MHKQTKATSIPYEVKERVWERDGGRCVLCGRTYGAFPNAHFVARAHGGKGIEENILTLCIPCHHAYDQTEHREELRQRLRRYLQEQYPEWNEENLVYRKYDFTGGRHE